MDASATGKGVMQAGHANSFFTKNEAVMTQLRFLLFSLLLAGCQPAPLPENVIDSGNDLYTAALSSDGQLTLLSSTANGVQLWANGEGKPRYQWRLGEINQVLNAAISGNQQVAVVAGSDSFTVWEISSGENRGYYKIADQPIRALALSHGGLYLLLGQSGGHALHIDLESGRRLQFLGHQHNVERIDGAVTTVALSPNGRYALTGGNDGNAFLWDSLSGQQLHAFRMGRNITRVALDDQGHYALVADELNNAIIWDIRTGLAVSELQKQQRQLIFSAARFSQDGRQLLTGSPGRSLRLWSVADGKLLDQWQVNTRRDQRPASALVLDVAFGSNNQLWSVSSSGYIEFWQQGTR